MTSLLFSRKTITTKLTSLFTIVALVGQLLAPLATIAHAVGTPANVLGDYTIEFTCTGGYDGCDAWGPLVHTMTIDTQADSNFSGHGEATADASPWDVTGTIIEPNVTLDIAYTGAKQGYMIDLVGTRASDGNMSGTATDGTGTFTWETTSTPPTITVTATKIMCDNEADLPNWGAGLNTPPEEITAEFATAWLGDHQTCHLQEGWDFQWGDQNTGAPADTFVGIADGYQAFGSPTGGDGTTSVTIPVTGVTEVHLAEVQQDGYIPFTGQDFPGNTKDISAEIYCSSDIFNYDNYEGIGDEEQTSFIVPGKHYYCVAWNVAKNDEEEPLQCDPEVNLISNGSFEDTDVSTGGYSIVDPSNPLLKWLVDWVVTPASGMLGLEIQDHVAGDPADGAQHAELDGDHPVVIYQNIATIPGNTYKLDFKYSARPGRDAADNTIETKANGVVLGAALSEDGTALSNTDWKTESRTFVADSNSTKVEFTDTGTDTSYGGYLDGVSLTCQPKEDTTPKATIAAQKVICNAEADLPNWGAGGQAIDATTAQAWVDQSDGACHLASNWDFQWGDQSAPDMGRDFRGDAESGYTTFTNSIEIPLVEGLSEIHLREVLPEGYIPFTFDQSHQDNSNAVSAEFYCAGDALNYDNWDFIRNPQADMTYNCVAFNTIDPEHQPKQCDVVSDETNIVQESGDNAVETFVHGAWVHPSWMAPAAPFAKWIWSSFDVQSPTADETKTFIKEFNLSDLPTSAVIDVAADNGYTLYVNGDLVVDKIADEHNYEATTAYDVASKLIVGTNKIKMVVKNFGGNPNPHENPAGALYRLHIEGGTCTNPNPGEGKIHIIKFIDGERATTESADNAMFPMFINHPDGDFMLKANGWVPGDGAYEATTFVHYPGSKFTITENLATSLVGASCTEEKPYALVGYSTAATYEGAIAAPQTSIAPEITIDGDQYLIVHNHDCSNPTPSFLKVHVFKYLKVGDTASQIVNGDESVAPTKFPMHSSWDAANIGAGSADYVLGEALGGAAYDYAADTSSMQAPADYTTQELTDVETGVLPIGAQCSENRFRLVGYKSGDTLIDAQGAAISPTAPVYTDITSDKYVIVVNEDCDDVVPPPVDMCPNIQGDQPIVPDGYHLDNQGNCVPNISLDLPQCSDGIDNDGDEKVDFPNDPGCSSSSDNSETDESGGRRRSSGTAGSGGGTVLGASIGPGEVLGDSMCSEYIHTYIKFGRKNDTADVTRLQAFLNTYMGSLLIPNGIYNKETFEVLKAFQVKESGQVLTPWKVTPGGISDAGTGYVYKTTKRWINLIKCPQLNLPVPPLVH